MCSLYCCVRNNKISIFLLGSLFSLCVFSCVLVRWIIFPDCSCLRGLTTYVFSRVRKKSLCPSLKVRFWLKLGINIIIFSLSLYLYRVALFLYVLHRLVDNALIGVLSLLSFTTSLRVRFFFRFLNHVYVCSCFFLSNGANERGGYVCAPRKKRWFMWLSRIVGGDFVRAFSLSIVRALIRLYQLENKKK